MTTLKRIVGTDLFVPKDVDEASIRFLCKPFEAIGGDELLLQNEWPRIQLLFWSLPLIQPGETFSQALARVSGNLDTADTDKRIGFVYGTHASGGTDWIKMAEEDGTPGGAKLSDTLSITIVGGRYRLSLIQESTVRLSVPADSADPLILELEAPAGIPPIFQYLKRDDSDVSGRVRIDGKVLLNLSENGGTLKFPVDLDEEMVTYFGLENRVTEIASGVGGTPIVKTTRYIPLLGPGTSSGNGEPLSLMAHIDPLDPFDRERSYLEIPLTTRVELNLIAADGNPVEARPVEHEIPEHAGELQKRRAPRFFFSKQSRTLNGRSGRPDKDWQSFELDGAFSLKGDGLTPAAGSDAEPRELLTGLSDTETLRVSAKQRLVFRSGGPAFLPTREFVRGGEPGPMAAAAGTPPALEDELTMSWLGVESEDAAAETRIVSEGTNIRVLALNDAAAGPVIPFADDGAIRLKHSPLELEPSDSTSLPPYRHMVPILPFAGRPADKRFPSPDEIDLEQRVIQPMRRRSLAPPDSVGIMDAADEEIRTTPSGLRVAVNQGVITKLFLTRSDSNIQLHIENIPREMADALMRDQLFLVLNTLPDFGNVDAPKLVGSIQIGDWPLTVRLAPVTIPQPAGVVDDDRPPFLIIKDDQRPLMELIEKEDLWAGYNVAQGNNPFVNDIEATKGALRNHFNRLNERRKTAAKEAKPAYDRAAAIWDHNAVDIKPGDKGWRGVLFTNAELSLSNLPDQLAALAGGLSGKTVYADYLGIDLNRLQPSEGKLEISVSPIFGLVDYFNSKAKADVAEGSNPFNIALERLIVRFENGSVHSFYAKLLLLIRGLFDQPVRNKGGGDKDDRLVEIEGSRESRISGGEKLDIYTFQNRQEWTYTFDSADSLIKDISMGRVAYSTTRTRDVDAETKVVESGFSIAGRIEFNEKFPPKLPLFELDKLAFKDLNIDLLTQIRNGVAKILDTLFSPSNFSLDFKDLQKAGGLFAKLPFKPVGFEWWKVPTTLDDLGYFGFGLDPGGDDLLAPEFKYGIRFDLDLGSLGNLGKKLKDFKLSALLGWRQKEDVNGPLDKSQFCLGFKLQGNGGDGLDIGIGNVLRIKAERYDFQKNGDGDDATYFICAVNAKLIILGETFPEDSRLNLFMFVDAKNPKFSSLGWLAVLHNETGGNSIIDLKTLAVGQRIDPFSGGSIADRPPVKQLMDRIEEMGKDADDDALNNEQPNIDPILTLLKDDKIRYKPDSAWTVGLRSTMFDTFDLDFVLRDPDLYGIRVAYGEVFSIDIAYRKLTEELGVYSTEILLPESIRSFEMGAASFTIGVIGLEIFTDGGVSVDFGYPANRDFERAFSVEVLPFTGSGGFRISRVSGAGSRMIPRLLAKDAGKDVFVYEPVTEIALGGRFGLGKCFRKGPLLASLSVTFYAYLAGAQGILRQVPGTTAPAQDPRPRSTYVVLAGTVGVLGEIIGFVDFGIVKAGVLVRVYVEAGLVFETDRATVLYMEAGVSVACVVVIGRIRCFLGSIEIKISFRFSTQLRYNWELGSTRTGYGQIYNRSQISPALSAAPITEKAASTNIDRLPWENLPEPKQWRSDGGEKKVNLDLSLVPDMTFACYAAGRRELTIHPEAVLLLSAPIRDPEAAETTPQDMPPTDYEQLIRALVFWAVAAHKGLLGDDGAAIPLDELVSINDLIELSRRLSGSDEQLNQPGTGRSQYRRTPLYAQLTGFLKQNFQVRIRLLPDVDQLPETERRQGHAFFPMPEDIEIRRVGFPGDGASTKLWERKLIDEIYRGDIDKTFSRLVEELTPPPPSLAAEDGYVAETASLASVIFEEHFGVLMRMGVDQLLQLMQDRYADGTNVDAAADRRLELRKALELLTRRTEGEDGASKHRLPLCETALFAGRFFMHGLNLPKLGLDLDATKVPGPLVDLIIGVDEDIRGKGLPLFRLASLQQPLFAGQDPDDDKKYGFSFARRPDADWLTVDASLNPPTVGEPAVQLDLIEYNRAAATRVEVANFVEKLELDTNRKVTAQRKEAFPLANRMILMERTNGVLAEKRALWRLPANLMEGPKSGEPDTSSQGRKGLSLKLRQRLNRGPKAKDLEILKEDGDPTGGRCWSIVVEMRIQQINSLPPKDDMPGDQKRGTPATPLKHIYQIGGVDEDMRRLLDALIMAAFPPEGTPASIDKDRVGLSLYALAPPSTTGGYGAYERVDDADGGVASRVRLVQINLSAEPRPDIGSAGPGLAEQGGKELVHADTSEPLEFIELVRRAAIVNSGGFFLHTASVAVERLFAAPPVVDKPKKGERSDPFLLLVVDVDPDVVEISGQPEVVTNAVAAPISALGDAPRMDQPGGDGGDNGELDWDAAFIETDSFLHEPLYPAGVIPLRFTLPDPDGAAENGNDVADMCTRFTLLDYAVVRDDATGENTWIQDDDGLDFHETLPIGSTDPVEGTGAALSPAGQLQFELNVPVARLSHAAGVADPSPYTAVGEELRVRYRLCDIYGNAIGKEMKTAPIKIQYVDRLLRIADLPLLTLDWRPDASFGGHGGLILRLRMGGSALARSPQSGTPPIDPDERRDRVNEMAKAYRLARHQLEAPGTSLELVSSLNGGGAIGIEDDERKTLAAFFTDCAKRLDELAVVPGDPPNDKIDPATDPRNVWTEIGFKLSGAAPEDGDQVDRFVEVDVRLVQRRDPDLVAPHEQLDMRSGSDPMVKVDAPVQPRYVAETRFVEADDDKDFHLKAFAEELEALISGFQVAVGARRAAGTGQQALWLVPKEVLAVSMLEDFHNDGPAFYAIPPLSTRLESFAWNDFPRYDQEPPVPGIFQLPDKDMDDLGRMLVRRIDEALSPEMVKAMLENIPDDAPGYLRDLLSVKDKVADFFAGLVTPILIRDDEVANDRKTLGLKAKIGGPGGPLQDRLKRRLSAAYELDTVLAFPLAFDAPKKSDPYPLLFGEMTFKPEDETDTAKTAKRSFSYDTSVIQAQHESPALISMMDAFELVPKEIYEHRLSYAVTHVQRLPWPDRDNWDGFAELSSEKRYRNTAWLRLVKPKTITTGAGGETLRGEKVTEIPVVLRDFPSQPTIRFATDGVWDGVVTEGSLKERICAARSWDYELGWDWDGVSQDDLKITVDYNQLGPQRVESDTGSPATAVKNLRAIARFAATSDMLWPDVSAFARSQTASPEMKKSLDNFLKEARELQSVLQDKELALAKSALPHERDTVVISRSSEGKLEVKWPDLLAAKAVEARMSTREDGTDELCYPEVEFQDIDILRFRSAWAQLDLKRNATFGSDELPASDDFVYRVGGIRTGDPLVPRNDVAYDLDIEPTAGSSLLEALTEFFTCLLDPKACLAPGRSLIEQSVKERVGLEVECCYLHGRLGDYFEGAAPGQRQPGAEMGKLANLRADPATCANETATLVRTWLDAKSVPKAEEGGWKGKLRLDVALFNEADTEDADTNLSDRPFLRIRRCLLPLKDLSRA